MLLKSFLKIIGSCTVAILVSAYAQAGTLVNCSHGTNPVAVGPDEVSGCPASFAMATNYPGADNTTIIINQLYYLHQSISTTGKDNSTRCTYFTKDRYTQLEVVECQLKQN